MYDKIVLSGSDDIEIIADLLAFGIPESCLVLDSAYKQWEAMDCLCVLDIEKTFKQAGVDIQNNAPLEWTPYCPQCEIEWEADSFLLGCWRCDYKVIKPTNTEVLEPPNGCQEIPGCILTVGNKGELWLTQNGEKTDVWEERGIWRTVEEAKAALTLFAGDE
jgi:hypothetical protein